MSLNPDSLFGVNGLVALITGGGTGIGLMMTKALVQNGASKVYIVGRRLEILQQVAASLGAEVVIPIQCDVTSKDDLARAVEKVKEDVGYLNLLICNSGVFGPNTGPVDANTSLDEFVTNNLSCEFSDFVQPFAVNVAAVWFTTISFLPLLDAGNKQSNLQQTSQVIVTSSIGAMYKRPPGGFAYTQSKATAITIVKQLSTILPQWKIRVNCLAPGFFPSEMAAPLISQFQQDDGNYGSVPTNVVPIGRLGDAQDIGGTIVYLASRAGAYANGTVMIVDGARLSLFPSSS